STIMATAGNKNINAKLVLLGDVGAGKSSLVLRFVKDQFVEFQESTIGAAFFSQTLAVNDATVKFEIWDTAGQERYHSLAPMYYRGAAAAIIVFDITNQASFERAKKWVQELQAQGGRGICAREQPFLHGNLSEDCNKCQRHLLRNRKKATARAASRKPNRDGSPKRARSYGSKRIMLCLRELSL
ncbi:hypothetical protein HID58_090098, partial [Brassica napus]